MAAPCGAAISVRLAGQTGYRTPSGAMSGDAASVASARIDIGSLTVIVVPLAPVARAMVAPSCFTKAST